jgi:hypothetical protein
MRYKIFNLIAPSIPTSKKGQASSDETTTKFKLNYTIITRLIIATITLVGIFQLFRSLTALFSPFVTDMTEIMTAIAAEQFAVRHSLADMYMPPNAYYGMPGVQYPPLFILLTWGFMQFGFDAIFATRLISWLAYLGAAVLVSLIVWQETRHKWASLIAGLLPFSFYTIVTFLHTARVDPLAVCLALGGVYLYRRINLATYIKSDRNSFRYKSTLNFYYICIAVLLASAFFVKQTFLVAAGAILIHGVMTRQGRRRGVLLFGMVYMVLLGLGAWLTIYYSDGTYLSIFDTDRAKRFIFALASSMVFYFMLNHLPVLLIGVIGIWQYLKKGDYFFPIYSILIACSLVTIVKDGANTYYFTELVYLVCAMNGIVIAKCLSRSSAFGRRVRYRVFAGLAIQAVISASLFLFWSHWNETENYLPAYKEGVALVQEANATGERTLVFANQLLMETNQTDKAGDYFIYSILLHSGGRDAQELADDLGSGKWGKVITVTPDLYKWESPVKRALLVNYNLRTISGKDGTPYFWVYTYQDEKSADRS